MAAKITQDLCEIAGAVMGDGNLWTDGSRYRIEMTGDSSNDKDYFLYLRRKMHHLFDKEPYPIRVRHFNGHNWITLRLQPESAFNNLTELGIPHGSGKARKIMIPKTIMEKGWKYSKWTVRGLWDTDGTVFFSKKTYSTRSYPTLELTTMSEKLAMQLEELLNSKGFRAHTRGDATTKNRYRVAIYGKPMLIKWMNEIGFSNKKHLAKFKAYKRLYIN